MSDLVRTADVRDRDAAGNAPPPVVSASRRCDIPAHYPRWFLERLRAGWCAVRNPYDASKVRRVPLKAGETACLVFWTRDPASLALLSDEVLAAGLPMLAQVTINGHPRAIEPGVPDVASALEGFALLSDRIGAERVIWRRDPILVADGIGEQEVLRGFDRLSRALEGKTRRVVLSLIDEYAGTAARLRRAGFASPIFGSPRERGGPGPKTTRAGSAALPPEPYAGILREIAGMAAARGMECLACAEPFDLSALGIGPSACIDPGLISEVTGGQAAPAPRDRHQRPECRCAASVDIGAYGTCPAGCAYCYANRGRGRLLSPGPGDESL